MHAAVVVVRVTWVVEAELEHVVLVHGEHQLQLELERVRVAAQRARRDRCHRCGSVVGLSPRNHTHEQYAVIQRVSESVSSPPDRETTP
eukprot:925271-Pyramimonas_sp.AAC.1